MNLRTKNLWKFIEAQQFILSWYLRYLLLCSLCFKFQRCYFSFVNLYRPRAQNIWTWMTWLKTVPARLSLYRTSSTWRRNRTSTLPSSTTTRRSYRLIWIAKKSFPNTRESFSIWKTNLAKEESPGSKKHRGASSIRCNQLENLFTA